DWDGPAERKRVRPALPGSWETLFHEVGLPRFLVQFDAGTELERRLAGPRLGRAIGVLYRPETERASHYYESQLSQQFDAVIHVDRTRAVEPLERVAKEPSEEPPETYPFTV